MDTAGVIRMILLVDIVVMSLFALIYLRQRRLGWMAYCGWGLLALFLPVLGPFLVIANRPGMWDPDFSLAADFRRLVNLVERVLPGRPAGMKLSRLDQARLRRQLRKNTGRRK